MPVSLSFFGFSYHLVSTTPWDRKSSFHSVIDRYGGHWGVESPCETKSRDPSHQPGRLRTESHLSEEGEGEEQATTTKHKGQGSEVQRGVSSRSSVSETGRSCPMNPGTCIKTVKQA